MKKTVLSLFLALAMACSLFSCSGKTEETKETGKIAASETTSAEASETSSKEEVPGTGAEKENDAIFVNIGEYVTLMYNPAVCDVSYETVRGLGSSETITFTASVSDGFRFFGWSRDNALCNVKDTSSIFLSAETSFEFSVGEEDVGENSYFGRILILPNVSYVLTYHANGGISCNGTEEYEQTYSAVWYKCASTLPEQEYFTRDGYTLLEYNTEPDGSGYAVSLGSRIPMSGSPALDLYCIWAKQNDASDFIYRCTRNGVTVKGYVGTSDTIVFPEKIEGVTVKAIASGFTSSVQVKHMVFPKDLYQVANGAFSSLTELESVVMYDSLEIIYDTSFSSASFTSLRINARWNLFRNWGESQTTTKLDRLLSMLYGDKKSFIVFGGSGSLEGIDSPQIVSILPEDYDYVNLASNANLSAAFYFDWLEDYLSDGDVLLWIPEKSSAMLGSTVISERVWELNAGDYDLFRNIDISKYSDLFSAYVTYTALHKTSQQSYEIFPLAYNIYGDWIAERVSPLNVYTYNFNTDCSAYAYMAELIREICGNGVRILFTYPGVDETSVGVGRDSLEGYFAAVQKQYPEIECISGYETALTPHEMMYDSMWHFTREGAVFRTAKIAEDLKKYPLFS